MRKNLNLLDKNNCQGDYLCIIQSAVTKADSKFVTQEPMFW